MTASVPTRPRAAEPLSPAAAPTRRAAPSSRTAGVLRWAGLAVLCVIVLFPVYATLATAFLPAGDVARGDLLPDPRRMTLDNVRQALSVIPLLQQYLVSAAVTLLQTGAQLITGSLAAYALVFPAWRGRTAAFAVVVATLAIPGESVVIPNVETVSGLGLRDTVVAIALPYLCVAYPVFLLRQAFATLPREVWEAARLDGAGHLRCLTHVVVPMTWPQLVTAALWSALSAWNGYFWPLLITDSAAHRTVQVGLAQLVAGEFGAPGVIYAGTLVVLAPTLLLVLLGQRFLVRGLAARIT
ncbi:carbohydrate ABC transporter permease [Pseudonocardia sp. CA-142604]|uniref:carbohydrate ABC transporter permease n=1 Tax=Pseudonocardia sp. CA-142604 TaxID=3240024 RepID=UPI003D8DFEC0